MSGANFSTQLLRYTKRWISSRADSEFAPQERMQQVRVATTIGAIVGFLFSIFNLLTEGMLHLGLIELFAVVCLAVPALVVSQYPRWVGFAETLLLLAAMVIFGALIVLGGVESTGLFWVYTTPFLAFFLKGQRLGRFYSVGFFLAACVYLLWLAPHLSFARVYTPITSFHFLLSLGFYTLVASAFDYVRTRYDDQLRLEKEKAEAAYLAKSRFLAAASHDLRQPAHALGMFVSRLMQLPADAKAAEVIAGIDASSRAMQEMLDVFFDYSRLEAQSSQVVLRPVALGTVLEQLGFFFGGIAAEKGLRLRFRDTDAWVQSDPVLLQRILLNLVSNALQYTSHGTVLVACRPCNDSAHLRIEVWDSGVGIARQHHEKIFEEFFQVENQQRDRTKGLGLGLSMVSRSCRLLKHPLTLRSELGCGSRFTLTVPLAEPGLSKVASINAGFALAVPDVSMENMHVLLVEDDALGSSALVGLLQSWGCSVTLAESAHDAIERIGRMPVPDFVVSDFRLRGTKNGVEAIELLRASYGASLRACLISGDTTDDVKQKAFAAQLVLLQKPVAPGKLRSMLRRAYADVKNKAKENTAAESMD